MHLKLSQNHLETPCSRTLEAFLHFLGIFLIYTVASNLMQINCVQNFLLKILDKLLGFNAKFKLKVTVKYNVLHSILSNIARFHLK